MKSVWMDSVKADAMERKYDALGKKERLAPVQDRKIDVLVIGGGMAGILCAQKLKEAGVSCIVVEAKTVGAGVTQNTTAKITAQHALIYEDLLKKKGIGKARQYYEIQEKALEEYRRLSHNISCDLEDRIAYVYSTNDRRKLEREAEAYQKLRIPMHYQEETPLPFKTVGALGMEKQAQFNPLKFLLGLAEGLTVYENAFVKDIVDNVAITRIGRIVAKHIVLATHFPLVNIPGLYFLKMYQHRSYVLGLQGGPDLDGMYVDEERKGHSFRTYKDLLLLGGGSHRTGKKGGDFEELRRLAKSAYPDTEEKYAWATQDCMTLDKIPYVGIHRKSNPYLYVATGFNKWGMTGSMAAAMVLTDLIVRGKSEYEDLFSPGRSMLHPQLLSNVGHATAGLVSFGKRCTHMGCALRWNAAERTWDCSCHGSRFDEDGDMINNPAKKGVAIE